MDQFSEFARQATTILRNIWLKRWLALWVAFVTALIGAVVVWFVPERYEANARLYVDTQTVLKPLMAGLAFQPDIDQQVRMLGRTVVSRPNVEKLVKNPALNLAPSDPQAQDQMTDSLLKKIVVEHSGGGNLYLIKYRDTDPQRARRVVESLVNLFVDAGADTKRRDSEEASKFIDEQIKSYETKLVESENRLKDFKLRNFGLSGVSNQDYFARMSALADEVNRLQVSLGAAEQSRDALKRELAGESPQLPSEGGVAPAPVVIATPEIDARIAAHRRQLDELLRRYTEEHPDVVMVNRQIGQLEAQRASEIDAQTKAAQNRARTGGNVGGTAPTSPVFQRLRIALAEAEANVASLRTQLNAQQGRLNQIRATASRVPQVEAELAQLNRDYDVIRRNYDQLVGRREAASLGVKIDQKAQLADFRIVEPPRVLPTPVFPGRRLIAAAAMLMSIVIGCLAAYGLSRAFPVFHDVQALGSFSKRPVLGSLATVTDGSTRVRQRMATLRFAGSAAAFFIANVAWVVWVSLQSQQ